MSEKPKAENRKKMQLKEITLKVSQFHVCKFNPQKAEWTLVSIGQPNQKLQASIPDMTASLPMNSIVQTKANTSQVDVTKVNAQLKETEARKAAALTAIQAYEDKISRVQQELKQVQQVCATNTSQWAFEKTKRMRLAQETEAYRKMLRFKH